MYIQPQQETSLSVWNKLMDFRMSHDAVRQSRLKSFLTVEAFIMLGFAYSLSQAFAYKLVLPEFTFFTLATALCFMGLLLAWQSLKAHKLSALTLRQLSHDIHDVERHLGGSTTQEISVFSTHAGPTLGTDQASPRRQAPIKLTYVREMRRNRPLASRRAKQRHTQVAKSPDRLVMWATVLCWAAAFIATLAVSCVAMSPSLDLAMEKAAQHSSEIG